MKETDPYITIDLPNHLIDFLHHEFKTDETGAIILETSKRKPIGLFINSMWESSDFPVKRLPMDNPIRIRVPKTDWGASALRKFLFVPKYKLEMIVIHLQAAFELRRERFFYEGARKGYPQKLIIEAFMKEYGRKKNSQNFDQLKKMDYRNRDYFVREINREIQSAVIQ
ncbi:MAG: hypothetical protein PHV20_12430 [Bacteroidales bacterium]|nr:hypothetical protein [Bacteroidales bacterium]